MNKVTIFRATNGYIITPDPERPYTSPFASFLPPAPPLEETEEPEILTFVAKTWEEAVEIAGKELAGMEVPAAFKE